MSVAMFIFPSKEKSKEYIAYKNPREVLEISDEEVVKTKHTKFVYYVAHYNNDLDKLEDKEIVSSLNKIGHFNITIGSRKSGLGYTTEDKENFIRLLKHDREWFEKLIK